ncbi:integrase arm-type DNA-binding domain-containing protein [Pseudomonas coleopterorum]|uniref:Integrase arm-type DNA-binding domain-containing protein n=1 Tax=Pseudomonas coleopterorum TaxID=1605838 RepID=A0ABR9BYY1_9PSED|nr:integrase arm-type DNA-binding domain-containing protein [Pseudomonas coleopterorum]MBD8755411.1 integrase arm-type DNA-binding domain-containing protein [Pseudomonas coleopterorum]MBD8770132.1 integrase arm-type DNA-binding domain-containing protein [Pseudomonas coleopterorum]MDY1018836.1 integrase arm-type DNA-binding domain-containing protein [Pseudomonas coleopterorum]
MGKLNPKQIENLTTSGTYEDGEGLRMVVKPTGKKYWVLRYQLAGKRREMGLGSFPTITLKKAREAAAEHRKLLSQEIDPLVSRDAERKASRVAEEARQARAISFRTVAEDYITAHKAGWKNAKHSQQWLNTLTTYAFPVIGDTPTEEVTTEQILRILTPIWHTKPETASRVRNRMEMVLDAAKARRLRDGENPARWRGHLDKLLPPRSKVKSVVHHPALPWRELPGLISRIKARDEPTYKAMLLTILTACRTNECLAATWDEIDLKNAVWKIPAHRMKAGKEHRIPLSQPACDVLRSLIRIKDNPYVFPSTQRGKHLSNMAMLMGLRYLERGDLTIHGFRSTFRDWSAEATSYPREVCEQALAHNRQDKAEAAYFRTDLFEKRRAMMEEWAEYGFSIETDKKQISGP